MATNYSKIIIANRFSLIYILKPAGNYQFSIFNSQFNESPHTPKIVPSYVLSVHDFCHERLRVGALAGISANQASMLALAAPKIQDSKFCPQISTDFKDFSQARKHIKVQDF